MSKPDKSKIVREYGWFDKKKQYSVEIKEKTYMSGRKSEKDLFSYSYVNRMTTAQIKEILAEPEK